MKHWLPILLIATAACTNPPNPECPTGWTALRTGNDITYTQKLIECRSPDGTQIAVYDHKGRQR